MKLLAAILFVTMLAPFAHAQSDYEQRAQLAGQRASAVAYQKALAELARRDNEYLRPLAALGARHGGFAKISCTGPLQHDITTTRQACAGNFCIPVGVIRSPEDVSGGPAELVMWDMMELSVMDCDFTLNDGLACQTSVDYPKYGPSCLDAQGNEVRASAPAARKPVKKKR